MLPAVSGTVVFISHIIQVFSSDWWQVCLSLYLYGPVPFPVRVFHSSKLSVSIFIQYSSDICCCWGWGGGGAEFMAGGREGSHSPFSLVLSWWPP